MKITDVLINGKAIKLDRAYSVKEGKPAVGTLKVILD
jgi:hypothetical protein